MTARMTNGHWLIAQIGLRRSAKELSRSMLLDPTELPGSGWTTLSERYWRSGMRVAPTDEGKRARHAGNVTAWRSCEQSGASRWLWAQVAPMVSEQDAASYVPKVPSQLVADPRAKRAPVERRTVKDSQVPGLALASVVEGTSADQRGSGLGWTVIGQVGSVVLVAQCSCYNDAWSWSEAKATIALQVEKIRRCVDLPATPE
jgi:hypothetical protein